MLTAQQKYYRKNADRYQEWRDTHKGYGKEYADANREQVRAYHRDYNRKLREKFFEMYGKVCACCGEAEFDFLTIEHKLGQHGKRETSYKAFLTAVKEYRPDLYETLCMNCNHAKGRFGICPHQKGHRK